MIRTIHKAVTAAATSTKLETVALGATGIRRKILGIFCETIANVHLRLYIGTDRICEISGDIVSDAVQPIPVDKELSDGDIVQVGWYNGTGAEVTHDIAIQIEESETGV